MESVQGGPALAHNACVVRQEGPWRSGDTYLITINTEGRVFFHSKSAVLGGRPLRPDIWRAIAAATGAAALRTTGAFGNPNGGALPAQIGGLEVGGYAVGFQRAGASPLILLAGLDIGEAHLDTETIDPGDPSIRADQVVDRETLKTFVKEARDFVLTTFRSQGRAAFNQVKSVLRDPNGPWRHGPVYLFIMDPTGYTIFHGAFPDRFEFRRPTDTLRDQVTNQLILPQIIQTATSSQDGGYVEYYFDNPDDPNDDFNTLKVSYAIQHRFETTLADGSTFEYPLIFGAGIYGEGGGVLAQGCPLPAGVAANPLADPSITAEQVEAGTASISDFALAARDYMESVQRGPELAHNACVVRQDGPWKSGSTYLTTISTDGRVFFHAARAALGGRPLKRTVYGAILRALGITATAPADVMTALANVAMTGSFPNANGGQIPGVGGYAVGFQRAGASPLILVAGLDIGEAHLDTETIDPGDPTVRADEVVDRATLKTFVKEARDYVLTTFRSEGRAAFTQVKSVLRDPNGPWRHGPVYLFIMEPTGYTIFHGAFPDRFEFRRPTDTLRDEVTGRLILPQIIRTATTTEDGGFVQYYFDNPDDPNDDFNSLKVTYAIQHRFEATLADGSTFEYPLIFGAGIYGEGGGVLAQGCPLPAGVTANPLADPSITAEQVETGAADLRDFALAARDYMESVQRGPELAHNACVVRQDGPWKSGSTYLTTISTEGRVFFHAARAALGGRPLKRPVWQAIAAATGAAALRTTGSFGNPNGGALPAQIGGGYAVGFQRAGASPVILVAGLDIGEAHLDTETIDPGDPTVRADEVVDRATLKTFVKEARDYVLTTFRSEGRAAFTQVKSVLRDPNGPWRHGPVYLFIMEPTGYTIFHGAFPDRFEFRRPTDTLRDEVTGRLILPQIIRTATTTEDGGFVQYYFDNPDDPNDDFNSLKVTYAIQHRFETTLADGSTFEYPLIFGAGIYGDPDTVAEDVCPRPAGLPVSMYETPSVTASQAAAGGSLRDFALAGRGYFNSIMTPQELAYSGCLIRNEGPWKSGDTYIVALSLDGRVILNGKDMSTGGRPLQPAVYGAILRALGITATTPADVRAALANVATTGSFPNANGGMIPGIGGYAVGYGTTIPYILLAGVDLQEAHFAPDTVDPGDPDVSADEVVDRATLKLFVNGAIDYLLELYRTNPHGTIGIARSILRNPPWRSSNDGPTYLFIMEESGYTLLHAGFPNRYEFQTPTQILRDEVTGELILPQIIEAAKAGGDEGAFVRYYFDDPSDDSDSADVPKVTYARQLTFTVPGGPPVSYIIGAGIYRDESMVSDESVAATRGWLARFGRALGSQAVEMISGRLNAPAQGGAKMTLGGQTVKLDADPERYLTKEDVGFASLAHHGIDARSIARARTANRLTSGEADSTGAYREMTLGQLLSGARFHLASAKNAEGEAGSQWSIWGRGAQSSFEGGGDAAIEGDVTTAMLGVDYEKGKLLAGVALARASGDGGFENDGRSEIEATLTSVHPYLRYAASERLSLWGVLGMGQGEMTLDDEQSGEKYETDIDMRMGAFGVRGALAKVGGFDLAVKSDVLLTQMDSDAKDGLESISAESSRLRVLLEASREVAMEGGGTFRPSLEAGLRHDGGDVDEGLGVEVGGGLRFTNPGMGLTFEVKARGLITHEEEDVADWGVGGMIRIAPGKAGRGLALTVEPSVGRTASGAARLWGIEDASRLAKEEIEDLDPRVRAEVGYGLDAWGGLLTPYAGLSVSDSGNGTYRVGGRFRMGERLSMSLEGDVRERVNADPVHGLALRGSLRW
ncbi:MAG: autotransporter domain-containing protein [Nitrospinae bacterium]|nr:autotransporter domain-containing protein [Nitrospinota bacterium]